MKRTDQFSGYSGENAEELLSYPAKGQHDLLVRAFEEAIQQKAIEKGEDGLTREEQIVLAVRALDREVNNGGYHQFFSNSSRRFTSTIVDSLLRIGCQKIATITMKALEALAATALTSEMIGNAMSTDDAERDGKLEEYDQLFYEQPQSISPRLYSFIKANRNQMKF